MLPRVFVGSSVEGLSVANAVQQNLEYIAHVTVWNQGVFDVSRYTLEALQRELRNSDFGIFVFTPDDITAIRGTENATVRDNVIYEHGMFIGHLGRDRTYFLVPRGSDMPKLPTDLHGITPATFDSLRTDNLQAALGSACSEISRRIESLGPIRRDLRNKAEIDAAWTALLNGATRSVSIFAGDASWAKRDAAKIAELVKLGIDVRVLYAPHRGNETVRENISTLQAVGAKVRRSLQHHPIRAILVDGVGGSNGFSLQIRRSPSTSNSIGLSTSSETSLYSYDAELISPNDNSPQIEALNELFNNSYQNSYDSIELAPIQVDLKRVADLLSTTVPQYNKVTAGDLKFVTVSLEEVLSSCRFALDARLTKAARLVEEFALQNLSVFEPVICSTPVSEKIILPPLVEPLGDKFVIIDGLHRTYHHLLRSKMESISCISVTTDVALPSTPTPLESVAIIHKKRNKDENFKDFDQRKFRPIREVDLKLATGTWMQRGSAE